MSRREDSEISDNRLVLCQPWQPLSGGQPQPGASHGWLLCHPLKEEKELIKKLGCGAQKGLSGTQQTWELWRCPLMLCRSDCTQTRDLWSHSAARLITSSVRLSCAMWCSCAIASSAKPVGPKLYHWSNSGWLCESVCVMATGPFPPHSSLFFRKHKSQRDKLLSALSLLVYSHYEKWAGGMHSFHSKERRANHRMCIFGCCSLATLGDHGAGLAARGLLGLPVQKQLLQSASMPLQ